MAEQMTAMKFVAAWEKFKISHCDAAVIDLSRSIQDLSTEFDKNMYYTYVHEPICQLLGDNSIPSLLLSHALLLLDRLVEDFGRRQDLIPHLLPKLSYQIIQRYKQQPSDSLIKLCLKSLTNAVQDVDIRFISSYTEDLIKIVIKLVLKSKSFQDDSLAVLASLSRNNLRIQGIIKSQENIRSLYTLLMKLISNDNSRVVVYALSLFTTLCLNEDLGDKIFVGSVVETFTLVKDTLNFVGPADQDVKLCCINLLIDFTKSETMLSAFVNSQEKLLEDLIISDLVEGTPPIRNKVCSLLQKLATKNAGLYDTILKLLTPEIKRSLVETMGISGTSVCFLQLLHTLLPSFFQGCDEEVLIKHLVHSIESIPERGESKERFDVIVLSCQCLRVIFRNGSDQKLILSQLSSLPATITSWLDSVPHSFRHSAEVNSCTAVLEMISLTTDIDCGTQILSHANLHIVLGQAMLSGDSSVISTVLRITALCTTDVFSSTLSDTIAHHSYLMTNSADNLKHQYTELQQKYTDLQLKSCNAVTYQLPVQTQHSSQVSDLIAEMRDGLHISDVKTSQLIEIFQEKISIMVNKEEQLLEFIETKTEALQQSDRLFTQFKLRIQQAEKECAKYRSLLQDTECEADTRREEMCTLTKENNLLSNEVEGLRSDLVESNKYQEQYAASCEEIQALNDKLTATTTLNSELADKLEGLTEEIETLKAHNETLKSQHESDVMQVQVLQKEKQKVVTKLEEKDSLYLKTKQTLRQSEEKNRKKDKENIELETQISKLKSDLSKTESKYKELLDREASLESKLIEREKLIEAQKAQVEEKIGEIEKYSKLMAMFHNLSGGKGTQR